MKKLSDAQEKFLESSAISKGFPEILSDLFVRKSTLEVLRRNGLVDYVLNYEDGNNYWFISEKGKEYIRKKYLETENK